MNNYEDDVEINFSMMTSEKRKNIEVLVSIIFRFFLSPFDSKTN